MPNLKEQSTKLKTKRINLNEIGNMIRCVTIDDPTLMFDNLSLAQEITNTFGRLCLTEDVDAYFKLHEASGAETINGNLH